MKRLYIVLLFICISIEVFPQQDTLKSVIPDTLRDAPLYSKNRFQMKVNKMTSSRLFQMTYISVPLVLSGLIIKNEDDHFRNLRNEYVPSFNNHYDDYLQYLPGALMLSLKTAGVEGRSSWQRMMVSDAISVTFMATVVNALKVTTKEMRPDGSGRNSFPSGHSATAFMTATMLHKEYGLTRSPWYSVAAYTMATATAVTRELNNKHWLSDILVGAGIGVFSTELGYYLGDLIFKEKGIKHTLLDLDSSGYQRNPSFFGLYMGFSIFSGKLKPVSDISLDASAGSRAGFEGAYFINRYIGFGSRFSVTSLPVSLDDKLYFSAHPAFANKIEKIQSDPFDVFTASAGPYLSYPIADRLLVGSKLLMGYSSTAHKSISATYRDSPNVEIKSQEIVDISNTKGISFGTGLSLVYIVRRNLGVHFFMDYDFSPAHFTLNTTNENQMRNDYHLKQSSNVWTLGASVNVQL